MPPQPPPSSILESVFNHAVLPPQLPGRHDSQLNQVEQALCARLLHAAQVIKDLRKAPQDSVYSDSTTWEDEANHRKIWDSVCRALQACKLLNATGRLDKAALLQECRALRPGELLVLNITEQNAGLLISRIIDAEKQDCVLFEALEASPLSEHVLASEGALVWDFPGSAAHIAFDEFSKSSFQNELATFLERASTESIKRFGAQTSKASSFSFESRDTADPALISQILIPILEAIGQPYSSKVLRKRIRDEVYWNDGEKPWRRSPLWLILQVALLRHLATLYDGELARIWYKFHLLVFFNQLLSDCQGHASLDNLALLRAKLCRRIVKLKCDQDRSKPQLRVVYDYLFSRLEPTFVSVTDSVNSRIKNNWEEFKQKTHRRVPAVPRRAHHQDLQLSLKNCSSHILQSLQKIPSMPPKTSTSFTGLPKMANDSLAVSFAHRYYSLSQMESDVEEHESIPKMSLEDQCWIRASKLEDYLNKVTDAYETSVEQNSTMLLTVMKFWVGIDECAIQLFPTLKAFSPGLLPEMLNVLHLSSFHDMRQLLEIQRYLHARVPSGCRATIFDDPGTGCFAEKFFDRQPQLKVVLENIQNTAEKPVKGKRRNCR
ncbi:hypothetical protein PVAG01_07822 [Phlyctema vagabunda]|uniref:DUF6606 domain-containing protein n=1 Tax=Phlyctema vagabunda TaxID=108571 RepID=A0ABR4PDJ3_9HELO